MLHRKIYQLSREGKEVWIYLRDQGRWLERAKILDIEGDLVLVRYETEDEDEICAWEEMIRLESIGAVTQRLATVPKGNLSLNDLLVSDDCPDAEQYPTPSDEGEGSLDGHLEPRGEGTSGDPLSEEAKRKQRSHPGNNSQPGGSPE